MPKFPAGDTLKVGEKHAMVETDEITLAKLYKLAATNDVSIYSANGAIATSGIALITGGTGIAGLTLAAPTPGCRCEIRIDSLSSGNVVVTCAAGVTLDATGNTIATFDAAGEALILGYKEANKWQIIQNVGSVALSKPA